MGTRYFSLIMGILFVLMGLAGFVPNFVAAPIDAPTLTVQSQYGMLFGLFPVNAVTNIVCLALGIWGLAAYPRFDYARSFARAITIIFALLTVFGFIPGLNTLFGLMPLYGNDIWRHAIFTVVALYFGYIHDRAPTTTTNTTDTSRPVYHV